MLVVAADTRIRVMIDPIVNRWSSIALLGKNTNGKKGLKSDVARLVLSFVGLIMMMSFPILE